MAAGFELRNKYGDVYFSNLWTTWNYLDFFIAPANGSVDKIVPAMSLMSEFQIVRQFHDAPPGNQEAYVHTVTAYPDSNRIVANGGKVDTMVFLLGR